MALLVTDNGEIDSLRNLLNQNQAIPSNLILKLFTTNTYPAEADTPSQTAYYEPYTSNNTLGYGTSPATGYSAIINTRHDQDYSQQYGKLLNGNRWTIETLSTAAIQVTGSGTAGTYTGKAIASTSGTGTGMTVDVVIAGGVATKITINDVGTGYSNGDTITIAKANVGNTTADVVGTITIALKFVNLI